jgi:pSer/pThr/pTyr-binding forkhead associated (FHA) protein
MIVLVPIDADGEDGVPLEFDQHHIHVGRGSHNELVLDEDDRGASYEHALISVVEDRAVVVCELTANATYIDGADVSLAPEEERLLKPGDIISFGKGKSIFRVSRVGELAEPRRAARQKARAHAQAATGNRDSKQRKSNPPPPPGKQDKRHDRGVYPITFQVFKGDQVVREEVFNQPLIRIGRMKSSHLLLDDESVSRTHAVVEVTAEGEVLLLDLDSSSGTAVDGKRLKKAALKSGDEIEFGKARVSINFGAGFAASSTEVLSLDQLELLDSPRLVIRRSDTEQDEFVLTKACTTIGRLAQNDIQLDDGTVSGKHAMVVAEDGVCLIIDQHSTNGTYLNGKKCVGESLRHGDVIQVGRFELVFDAPGTGPGPRPKSQGTEILGPEAARAMFAKVAGRRGKKG